MYLFTCIEWISIPRVIFVCFVFITRVVSLFLRYFRYVGNIHMQVTEPLLQEVFASTGPVEGCKLIRKDKVNGIGKYDK